MHWILLGALLIGLGLLVFGYIKNNRNLLAASALLLVAGPGGNEFVIGFNEGYSAEAASHAQPAGKS